MRKDYACKQCICMTNVQKSFYNGGPSEEKNEKYLREKARMQAVHLYDKMQKTLLQRQAELKETINLKVCL